ncbi:hypothetical protein D3C73_1142060 [compost metagenome]
MEGAGPGQRRRLLRATQVHDPLQHAAHATIHFLRRAARKRQQQHALRVGAVQDQVGDAVRQRVGLARARPGDHQQGAIVARRQASTHVHAEFGGFALGVVQVG